MRLPTFLAALAAFALVAAGDGMAQPTGSAGYFTIHNGTTEHTLSGFYTDDGTGWSVNWLDERVGPGQSVAVEFLAESGECEQDFMAGWVAEGGGEVQDDPHGIDICEASNVYLLDNGVEFD